jgi:hypothetical protein
MKNIILFILKSIATLILLTILILSFGTIWNHGKPTPNMIAIPFCIFSAICVVVIILLWKKTRDYFFGK